MDQSRTSIDAVARRDFLRYRDRGDLAALARLFDARGPSLLLLAAHLTREAETAEDLVQETFLQVMRDADAYDPARPLGGWLAGILRHRALDRARQRARCREEAGHGFESVPSAEPGPMDRAADQEGLAQVSAAIERLSPARREVAVLRFVHGLAPVEIARALGRPPGTVRMQCRRVLQELRRCLPAGLATALAVTLTGRRGWAALRARILREGERRVATGAPGAIAASTSRSTVLWRRWVALGAAALMVGSVPLVLAATSAAPDPAAARTDAGARFARAADAAPRPGVADARAGRERLPVPTDRAWVLRGRVIDGAGTGVAGADVRVASAGGAAPRVWRTTSAGDGAYRIDLAALQEATKLQRALTTLTVSATSAGGRSVAATLEPFADLQQSPHLPATEVVLQPGAWVRGRVVDVAGRPVGGARVVLKRALDQPAGFLRSDLQVTEDASPNGRFALLVSDLTPDRGWTLSAGKFEHGVTVRELGRQSWKRGLDLGDVALESFGTLSGRLVMSDSTPASRLAFDVRPAMRVAQGLNGPLPQAQIATDGTLRPWQTAVGVTDGDGRFRIVGLAAGDYLMRVRDGFGTAQELRLSTGRAPVRRELSGQLLRVRVVDGEGAPLGGVALDVRGWAPGRTPPIAAVCRTDELRRLLAPHVAFAALPHADPDGMLHLLVPLESVVAVGASVMGAAFEQWIIPAHEGLGHRDVSLSVLLPDRPARVTWDVQDGAGGEIEELRVQVFPLVTEFRIGSWRLPAGDGARTVSLPPGDYRFFMHGCGGPVPGLSSATPSVDGVLRLGADEHVVVRETLQRGGWLRLRTQRPRADAEGALQLLLFEGSGGEKASLVYRSGPGEKAAWVFAQGAPRQPLVPLATLLPGPVCFRLTAHDDAGRLASDWLQAEIRAGEFTDVEVPLHRATDSSPDATGAEAAVILREPQERGVGRGQR
ncbi:MAG: sigma-70 family RNA polymerase sigma factor [Planctomycetota bacterium]